MCKQRKMHDLYMRVCVGAYLYSFFFSNFSPIFPNFENVHDKADKQNLHFLQLLLFSSVKLSDLSKSKQFSFSERPVCSVDIWRPLNLYLKLIADGAS